MKAISKEEILYKTHYGLNIYSHILRTHYPNQIAFRLVGRDCGLCRNPFNAGKQTLHIYIEKERILYTAMDKEFARHTDIENAIPAGDAFDFAELHYKQQGDQLLWTINKELYLHIGEERGRYRNSYETPPEPSNPPQSDTPLFSFFKAPISNVTPHRSATLLQIYNAIKGDFYKERTRQLRSATGVGLNQARKFKATNFDYCTFSGTFSTRSDKALLKHSGLLCIDFDHVQDIYELKNRLLADEYFDTQLLFISPSGDGIKWIIQIDTATDTHANYFTAITNYIRQTHGIEVDKSGKDISRACFLSHDPCAYINPTYLQRP